MVPRLSGRIAVYTSALLVVGVLLVPAAYALPEVVSAPGEAGRQVDEEDHTVSRAYRVIAPAYEVNTRGVGYAVWVEQDGNRYAVHGAYQSEAGRWSKGRRISKAFSWGGRLEGLPGEPDVAVDDRGRATVVWAQKVGRAVKIHTAEGGRTTGTPQVDLRQQRRGDVSRGGGFTERSARAGQLDGQLPDGGLDDPDGEHAHEGGDVDETAAGDPDRSDLQAVLATATTGDRQPGTATVAWVEVERVPTPEGFVYGRIQSATARPGGAWVPEEALPRRAACLRRERLPRHVAEG